MPLYIAKSGDLDRCYRCLTDWLTDSHLKDRATQLLIKYKSGALVTQKHLILISPNGSIQVKVEYERLKHCFLFRSLKKTTITIANKRQIMRNYMNCVSARVGQTNSATSQYIAGISAAQSQLKKTLSNKAYISNFQNNFSKAFYSSQTIVIHLLLTLIVIH